MKELSDEAIAAIGDHRIVRAAAAVFSFGETFRYWSGYGPIEIDSNAYEGIGAVALITPIAQELGGAAEGVTIELSDLDPAIAQGIEAQDYHQKPCVLTELFFNHARTTILGSATLVRGKVDTIVTRDIVGGPSTVRIAIEGPRRDMSRRGARVRSDADQRLLGGSTDGGLKHVSVAGRKTLYWGKRPATAAAALGGAPFVPSFNISPSSLL